MAKFSTVKSVEKKKYCSWFQSLYIKVMTFYVSKGKEEKIKLGVMVEFLSIKPFCEMIGMSEVRFTL